MNLKVPLALITALLLLAACASPTVARVDAVVLTRQELDERVNRIAEGQAAQAAQMGQQPNRSQIEQQVVNQFIDQNLLLVLARQRGISVSDSEVDGQIAQFGITIPQQTGGTLDEAVQDLLGYPSANSTEFRQFVSSFLAQQKLSVTLVETDTVRQRVTEEVTAAGQQVVPRATVAHILVATEEEAQQVLERLDAGESFEALAAELSTDPGSAQNGGVYENITPGQFVPEFDKAMFEDLEPGETTTEPVQTQFGYHIIRLISRDEGPAMTEDQIQQTIEQRVGQELQFARQQALQQLLSDEREKARQENRLEEPVYPTPTP